MGNLVYYGGKPNPKLLRLICKATGDRKLVFAFDDHEKRLRHDVVEFRKLVRRFRRSE